MYIERLGIRFPWTICYGHIYEGVGDDYQETQHQKAFVPLPFSHCSSLWQPEFSTREAGAKIFC